MVDYLNLIDLKAFGEKLEIRLDKRVIEILEDQIKTPQDIADGIGISRATLTEIFKGSTVSKETLAKVSQYLRDKGLKVPEEASQGGQKQVAWEAQQESE